MGSPKILGPNLVNPTFPPPPNAKPAWDAAQASAMATTVENIYKQEEKEKEQYKTVLMQKDHEIAQAWKIPEGIWPKQFKNMENKPMKL